MNKENKPIKNSGENATSNFTLDGIKLELLSQIADLHSIPQGAFNLRENGKAVLRNSTTDIEIVPKKEKSGIDIIVKPNVIGKSIHIPVIITAGGISDLVYNDFYIGDNSDVLIVAGCGIHTDSLKSEHNGIHSFHIGKNCKVKYIEKHLGMGKLEIEKVLNPITDVEMQENSTFIMETTQIGGVSDSIRQTSAKIFDNSKLIIKEKILTTEKQTAKTSFLVDCLGENSRVEVISRSVAKDESYQEFVSFVNGKNKCYGRVECDGLILDNAKIKSSPSVFAENINANLSHEAQIGKIASEQLIKLQTLGLNLKDAENLIINGYLQ
jgi:Fe-S cluster assembly scaffold protein SufB